MDQIIHKHLMQLALCFCFGDKRLFDLITEEKADMHWEFSQHDCLFTLTVQGKTAQVREKIDHNLSLARQKLVILCASRALWKTAGKLCGFYPSWGVIDGVKPVRLYLNLLEQQLNARDILSESYLISGQKADLVADIGDFQHNIASSLPKNSYNIYISIPFCPTRCKYCSFISADASMSRLIPDYLVAICEQIRHCAEILRDMTLNTIYIGGGTPAVLSPQQLETLLKQLKSSFNFKDIEFTLEAGRPDAVTAEKFDIAVQYGVNRVSVNTQTTNDDVLRQIGRKHTAQDYFSAFNLARKAGFKVINTDLIAGFDNDTFQKSLNDVIGLGPENITVHTLCVKNSANMRVEGFVRKNQDTALLLDYANDTCHNNRYFPYYLYKQKNAVSGLENIGYSKPGCHCLYNICMMSELNSTVAIGAGSSTKMVFADRVSDRTLSFFDCKYPKEYIENTDKILKKYEFLKQFISLLK